MGKIGCQDENGTQFQIRQGAAENSIIKALPTGAFFKSDSA
jgi:hypothetical protein